MARNVKRQTLGQRINKLRENRGMSLESLANETGQARDYLEKVETDQVIPPVAVLLTLGRALEVDSGELLKDEDTGEAVERRADAVRKRTSHYSYKVLTPENLHKHLKAFLVTIDPEQDLKGASYQHEGEEFSYVLKGKVRITVGENHNDLTAGESLHFNSGISHKLKNLGSEPAELLVVLYTP
ncbi:MAG: cupin domain-containing protein [Deltaproteobacteria bacterium]|nr:cupin domain-containing protein [Deltaproteobacteria bacterium]